MKHARIFILAVVFIFGAIHPSWSQSYRSTTTVPPVEVYKYMLGFVENGKYSKIEWSLNMLQPITKRITEKFSEDPAKEIRKALTSGDRNQIRSRVQRLIILDIKDLLAQAEEQIKKSTSHSRTLAKTARLNYELLSPYVKKNNFGTDQKIKRLFMSSFQLMAAGSIYSSEEELVDAEKIKQVFIEIVTNLTGVLSS